MKIGKDKIKHYIAGFTLSLIGGLTYFPFVSLGYIAGIAKETYDSTGRGKVELADLLWTWTGATTALIIILIFTI